MTAPTYGADLIAWVQRTTREQGVPEHIDTATFTHRLGALFDTPTTPPTTDQDHRNSLR